MAKEVLRGAAQKGVDCELLHLDDSRILFCKHCEACHKNILRCSLKDDTGPILKKMLEADGIILATPNYINQVTASMKALFDRSAHFIHCKRLLGKYIAGVVSSGSGRDQNVLDYIKYYSHTCGVQYSGGVSSSATTIQEKMGEVLALGKRLAADIKEKKVYPEQIDTIERGRQYFAEVIKLRKSEWQEEYLWWQEKGWL